MNGEFQGQIVRIPLDEAGEGRVTANLGQPSTIGEVLAMVETDRVLQDYRERADAAYLLAWQGGVRVPRGAQLGNRIVAWTQHGMVHAEGVGQCGVYERIKDVEGPQQESEMLIFTFPERLLVPTLIRDEMMGTTRVTDYSFTDRTSVHTTHWDDEASLMSIVNRDGSCVPEPRPKERYPYTNMMTSYARDAAAG